jgi:sodium-dependent dicarboxylate transporter 2/3/5
MTPPAADLEAPASGRAARVGLFAGPLLLALALAVPPPAGMSATAWATVGLTALMALWWATEAVPLPVTSLLPVVLLPALGVLPLERAAASYANPAVFLFLGGFLIGLAMERWNLHRRVALLILLAVGVQPRRQLAGFMLTTAFISMWVSNTATAIMMLPIAMSVIARLPNDAHGNRYATALLLGVAFAASIGGMATLVGTPPNAFLAGFLRDTYGIRLGFAQWMALSLPAALLMLAFTWWWLGRGGFTLVASDTRALLQHDLAALGPMSRGEKSVAVVFVLAAAAWVTQPLIARAVPWVTDTTVALVAGVALFVLPVDWRARTFALSWERAQTGMPWGVLLLFGGGLSLAAAINQGGLAAWMTQTIGGMGGMPFAGVLGVTVVMVVLLSEVASNTATAAAVVPLVATLAGPDGVSPAMLAVPATLAASCGFMLPVATPPNTLVYGTGRVPIGAMLRAGFALDLVGMVLVLLSGVLLVPLVLSG